jgi:hypothetical protein
MNKFIPACIFIIASLVTKAQKIDSVFFNLYTDSLKKGTWNYINVDGKLSSGNYLPLTDRQLEFKASAGSFERNSLWIDRDFKQDSVVVSITLKENPAVYKSITIYIKKKENDEKLKTTEEILNEIRNKPPSKKKKSKIRHPAYNYIFLASSKNLARPISVNGCFNKPRIESNGQVQTSAPASAHFTICRALRMEAANISVL